MFQKLAGSVACISLPCIHHMPEESFPLCDSRFPSDYTIFSLSDGNFPLCDSSFPSDYTIFSLSDSISSPRWQDRSLPSGDIAPLLRAKCAHRRKNPSGTDGGEDYLCNFLCFSRLRERTFSCLAVIFFRSLHFVLLLRDEQTPPFFLSFLEFGRG